MSPRVRIGLIVGLIGAVLNTGVSALFGFCGPFATLIAGAIAGLLTARATRGALRPATTTNGAIAGVITGGLMLIGQMLGAVISLLLVLSGALGLPMGTLPSGGAEQAGVWIGGLGVGLCFGVVGALLGAAGGAGAAYVAWQAPATDSTIPAV